MASISKFLYLFEYHKFNVLNLKEQVQDARLPATKTKCLRLCSKNARLNANMSEQIAIKLRCNRIKTEISK